MNVFLWNACARNGHIEATLNHPFPAQVATGAAARAAARVAVAMNDDAVAAARRRRLACNFNTDCCPVGHYSSTGRYTGTACDDGCDTWSWFSYSSCDESCDTCSGCSSCSPGTYAAGSCYTSCPACPAGQYQPYSGQTSCYNCAAGTYAGQEQGDSTSPQRGCSRSESREESMARFEFAPRDDRSSKNEPNRVENDRDRRL